MRKFLPCLLVLSLVGAAFCLTLTAGADEPNYQLIRSSLQWDDKAHGGCTVSLEAKEDGSYVFSGSLPNTWPAKECNYSDPITVPVDHYSLVYDFDVDGGNTNITFFFGSAHFPLSNSALGDVNYEAGSGDLMPDVYKGTVKLSDLIHATTNLNGEAFPESAVTDGKLTFTGLAVYSVAGATITVRALELIPSSTDIDGQTTESSDEPEPVESVPSDEPEPESQTPSAEPETSKPAASEPAVSESSEPDSNEPVTILGLQVWAFILVLLAAAAVIAVILYIVLGKRKKG